MRRLLQRLMSSTPSAGEVAAEFPQPRFTRLRLDAFPRGVDKIHIDVALGLAALGFISVIALAKYVADEQVF